MCVCNVESNLDSSVAIHVGLPQQGSRLSPGEVVAESPENAHHLGGVDAVGVVLVVESERSLDRLQERGPDLEDRSCWVVLQP